MWYYIIEICEITKPIYEAVYASEIKPSLLCVKQRPVEVVMWVLSDGRIFKTMERFTELEWEEARQRGFYLR